MAKIKQGILGGFSGKVANVVGTSWKGRAVMKSQPLSVANPRTEAQTEQRGKFSEIAKLASKILTTFVQPVENPIAGNISGYNKFVQDNKTAFDATGTIGLSRFHCGGGRLVGINLTTKTADVATQKVTLGWTNDESLSPLRLTDKVYAAVFTNKGVFLGVSSGEVTRADEQIELLASDFGGSFIAATPVFALVACVSADGREVSVFTNAQGMTAA